MQRTHSHYIIASLTILTYVLLITFQPSLQFMPKIITWFLDKQRLLELLLLGFVLIDATFVSLFKKNSLPISKPLRLSFVILLVLSCFSTSLAYMPRHALIEISVFAALSYFSLFIARLYQEDKALLIKYLTYIIWASILLYMASFYTGYITAIIVKKPLHWPFPFTGFTNIRSFNQYQLWLLGFVLLPLLCFELKRTTRILLHIALIFWWVLLFYSASRGVLIAWVIAMCLTTLVYRKLAWSFLRLQLMHLTLGYLSYQVLFKLIPSINESTLITQTVLRQTTNDRLILWDQAILLINNFPLFGVGPMHYAWFNKTNGHPHNGVLQLAAEWGLPATLIILTIAAYGFYHWFKKFNTKQLQTASKFDSNLTSILFFTIVANTAYSMVDGVIVMPISQVLMFTMIGLMIGQYIPSQNNTTHYRARFRPVIAGLLLIIMVWSTYPEIYQGFSGNEKGFSMGHTAIGPRFWRETK